MSPIDQPFGRPVTNAVPRPGGISAMTADVFAEIYIFCSDVVVVSTGRVVESIVVVELRRVSRLVHDGDEPILGPEESDWVGPRVRPPNVAILIRLKKRKIDTINFLKVHIRRLRPLIVLVPLPARIISDDILSFPGLIRPSFGRYVFFGWLRWSFAFSRGDGWIGQLGPFLFEGKDWMRWERNDLSWVPSHIFPVRPCSSGGLCWRLGFLSVGHPNTMNPSPAPIAPSIPRCGFSLITSFRLRFGIGPRQGTGHNFLFPCSLLSITATVSFITGVFLFIVSTTPIQILLTGYILLPIARTPFIIEKQSHATVEGPSDLSVEAVDVGGAIVGGSIAFYAGRTLDEGFGGSVGLNSQVIIHDAHRPHSPHPIGGIAMRIEVLQVGIEGPAEETMGGFEFRKVVEQPLFDSFLIFGRKEDSSRFILLAGRVDVFVGLCGVAVENTANSTG
mmetsp:Transcript_29648/g.60921  ORF Transcript_29648/g.60921 Transcript_29648/m.60921 type:complete len:448 (+) Transcript_29648:2669-4012(+)